MRTKLFYDDTIENIMPTGSEIMVENCLIKYLNHMKAKLPGLIKSERSFLTPVIPFDFL